MDKPERRKCLIVSETYLPLFGGAEMYTYNFAKQLVRRGIEVTILTYTTGDIPVAYAIPGVRIVHLPKISKREFWKLPLLARVISKHIGINDLIFANYTYALSTLTSMLGRVTGKKVTAFAHGLGTIIDNTHPKIYYVYRYLTLKLSSHVITTSEEIADIVRPYNSKVEVATAVDFSHIDACLARRDGSVDQNNDARTGPSIKTILTIRRLVEKNGIQYLIETLPYLQKLRSDFRCIVIGNGRLRGELEARVQELGLTSHVTFLGEMENEKVFSYIQKADVVAFPSSAEALSLAAIECMHIGTPIVVSAIGGLLELVGEENERGIGVDLFGRTESLYTAPQASSLPQASYEAFAHALDQALSRDEKITARTASAKAYVQDRYDWAQVADRILSFVAL